VRTLFNTQGRRHANTVIFNGTVRGMLGTGVVLGSNARVERLHALGNGAEGIVAFAGSLVSNSTVAANDSYGIHGNQILVTSSVIHGNAQVGIHGGYYKDNLLFDNNGGFMQASSTDGGGNICDPGPCS
jgi:hypothetical protein